MERGFAYHTPIEVSPQFFAPVQDILTGDVVLATGPDLSSWEEKQVTDTGGIEPNIPLDSIFYTVYQFDGDPEPPRSIITMADHLFLMTSGELNAIKYMRPDAQLRRADGGTATVISIVQIQYEGGVHHIALGEFNGHDLDGHLINSNGIISADSSVQTFFRHSQSG